MSRQTPFDVLRFHLSAADSARSRNEVGGL
jgi:hypothetical protein